MAAENDAGFNKGESVLVKRIRRISELVTGSFQEMMHKIAAGMAWTELCNHLLSHCHWVWVSRRGPYIHPSALIFPGGLVPRGVRTWWERRPGRGGGELVTSALQVVEGVSEKGYFKWLFQNWPWMLKTTERWHFAEKLNLYIISKSLPTCTTPWMNLETLV